MRRGRWLVLLLLLWTLPGWAHAPLEVPVSHVRDGELSKMFPDPMPMDRTDRCTAQPI